MIETFAFQMQEVASEGVKRTSMDVPNFAKTYEPSSITSFEEANQPLDQPTSKDAGDDTNPEEYKTLESALENTSEKERQIYQDANLESGEVNGREVLQRTDIDYGATDPFGRTNLERMEQGKAPLVDGKPIELHHIGQEMDSPLAELTQEEHRGPGNDGVLHDKQKESEIDRNKFNTERENHWKERADQVKLERGDVNE